LEWLRIDLNESPKTRVVQKRALLVLPGYHYALPPRTNPMMTAETIKSFRTALLEWSEDNLRSFSWRKTNDPYEVLAAEILLQKTAAEKVEPIYDELLATYPTPKALVEADQAQLEDIIYSLGLQNQRSRALISIGEAICDTGVPSEDEELLELPYVGRYAANATLCFAFEQSQPIVDANVVRVYNRVFDKEFDYRDDEAWSFAGEVLPPDDSQRYNLAILDFAATVCAPKVPNCHNCFFTNSCRYYRENRTD
jgi:A/G-specific adenine glycosylase